MDSAVPQTCSFDEKSEASRKHSFVDLIRTPKMRKQSLIVFYLWCVWSSVEGWSQQCQLVAHRPTAFNFLHATTKYFRGGENQLLL